LDLIPFTIPEDVFLWDPVGECACLLEKSKLAQHAYEEGHRVGWDDARILEIE
jgi:hypothetical protein